MFFFKKGLVNGKKIVNENQTIKNQKQHSCVCIKCKPRDPNICLNTALGEAMKMYWTYVACNIFYVYGLNDNRKFDMHNDEA